MWPRYKPQSNLVTIIFEKTQIICSWFAIINNSSLQFKISKTIPLTQDITHNLNNLTDLKTTIGQFLKRYHVPDSYAAITLSDQHIQQYTTIDCVDAPTTSHIALQSYKTTDSRTNNLIYNCTITHPLLMQYSVLAYGSSLNLVMLTSQQLALLTLYDHITTKLKQAYDISATEQDFLPHINQPFLASMVAGYSPAYHKPIAISAGLALANKLYQP